MQLPSSLSGTFRYCNRADVIVVVKEEKVCKIVAAILPQRMEKNWRNYQHLKHETATLWSIGKVDMILVVVGTFGTIQVA